MLLGRSGGATDCVVAWSPPRPQRAPASPSRHTVELIWRSVYLEFGYRSNVRAHTRGRATHGHALWTSASYSVGYSRHTTRTVLCPIHSTHYTLSTTGRRRQLATTVILGYPSPETPREARAQRGESARRRRLNFGLSHLRRPARRPPRPCTMTRVLDAVDCFTAFLLAYVNKVVLRRVHTRQALATLLRASLGT